MEKHNSSSWHQESWDNALLLMMMMMESSGNKIIWSHFLSIPKPYIDFSTSSSLLHPNGALQGLILIIDLLYCPCSRITFQGFLWGSLRGTAYLSCLNMFSNSRWLLRWIFKCLGLPLNWGGGLGMRKEKSHGKYIWTTRWLRKIYKKESLWYLF